MLMIKKLSKSQKSEDFELENKIEWIDVCDLVKEIVKEEGKQIAYFDADLVNSEGLILRSTKITVNLTNSTW
jgi:hypothetical protein